MKKLIQDLQNKSLLAGFILLLSTAVLFGQNKAEEIDNLLSKYHEYDQFNGSVLVADGGEVVFSDGYGMANMEYDIPNTPETKHRLGSITKQFTAALVLQLVEEGKLELDHPISTYLPNYEGPAADVVTIHHLLTHSSGIPSYTSFPNFFQDHSRDPSSPKEFVKTFSDSTLQFTPGEKFAYNNSGYFLLGHILEEVTGKSYEQALKERIFDPLNMNNTGYDRHETILKNRASGYARTGDGYKNAAYLDMSLPYAAGSLYSTVEDLYKWDRALDANEVLSEESKQLMFSSQIPAGKSQYGYGWMINKMPVGDTGDSIPMVAHGGGINGFNTLIVRFPKEDDLIVLLNNTGGAKLSDLAMGINNILHGEEAEMPKKSLAMALFPVFAQDGVEAGLAKYEKLKNDDTYAINEGEMNQLGYQLLQNGKAKEAIEVFKINVAEFPDSWNTYDSLGEAYMEDRQKEKAIANYEKSIQMNPENENGKKMLKKMQEE
ncbi:CubicO group peptidase, beta-lactamase class C family [Salinimicrobium catena]|uniref:CubicO group peptidase, beta-lactamase class C family n=1 Tax=Salinimicrobium catena TaxID=390640 RepID=A0A1H5MXY8_9FLAO|nr:serine hydrolase domain-containing protein [Salinimicrobium catena]SDL31133.1 CubicO group peptidase, beta-lactamase class C family [Salinimicrobium catena]SEE93587.1 CubicO group peptidase, beta-lactamase class C family [Salinimicrobium catena]